MKLQGELWNLPVTSVEIDVNGLAGRTPHGCAVIVRRATRSFLSYVLTREIAEDLEHIQDILGDLMERVSEGEITEVNS